MASMILKKNFDFDKEFICGLILLVHTPNEEMAELFKLVNYIPTYEKICHSIDEFKKIITQQKSHH